MKDVFSVKFNQKTAESVQVSVRRILEGHKLYDNLGNGTLDIEVRDLVDQMALDMHYFVLEMPTKTTKYTERRFPQDWWQAFRQRWFPEWWLRRWPVKEYSLYLATVCEYNVCPHLSHDPQKRHLTFLTTGE
jgi:hypothetical protein